MTKAQAHTLPAKAYNTPTQAAAHDLPTHGQPVPPLVLIRLTVVLQRTALSKTSIYDLMKAGDFPASIPLGGKSVAWVESEVNQWIADRIAAARGGAK